MVLPKALGAIRKIRNYLSAGKKTVAPVFESEAEISPAEITAQTFNFMAPEVMRNPYPYYEALRERGGAVHFLPINDMWLLLNHRDAVAALKQPHVFSSSPMSLYEKVLLGADLAAHKRARGLLAAYFAPQAVSKQAPRIKEDTVDLLDRLRREQRFDAIDELVNPLVEKNIARLLELKPDEYDELKKRLDGIDEKMPDRYMEEFSVLRRFFSRYIGGLDEETGDVFCRRLLRGGENQDDKFAPEEAASVMTLLWIAGTKTTQEALGKAILRLLRDPEMRAALESDRALIPQFFEEVLRFEPPARAVYRKTVTEVEVSGVRIPAGARVCLCFEAANRDAEVFPEPHSFVLQRNPKEHLAFSLGAHYCLGAHLGRLKAGIILETLLAHCPALRLAPNETDFDDSHDYRPLKELNVTAQ